MSAVSTSDLERRTFPVGAHIFEDGEPGDVAYIVETGAIEINKDNVVLGIIETGGLFGEMALLDDQPRLATAMAREESTCIVLPHSLFQKELAQTDAFMSMVMNALLTYVRDITGRMVDSIHQATNETDEGCFELNGTDKS